MDGDSNIPHSPLRALDPEPQRIQAASMLASTFLHVTALPNQSAARLTLTDKTNKFQLTPVSYRPVPLSIPLRNAHTNARLRGQNISLQPMVHSLHLRNQDTRNSYQKGIGREGSSTASCVIQHPQHDKIHILQYTSKQCTHPEAVSLLQHQAQHPKRNGCKLPLSHNAENVTADHQQQINLTLKQESPQSSNASCSPTSCYLFLSHFCVTLPRPTATWWQ